MSVCYQIPVVFTTTFSVPKIQKLLTTDQTCDRIYTKGFILWGSCGGMYLHGGGESC